jgi:hypothetical protein
LIGASGDRNAMEIVAAVSPSPLAPGKTVLATL